MSSWDVVVFSRDQSCEYLPSSWAVNAKKTIYLWPKKLSGTQTRKLRDKCAEPNSNIEYEEWAAVCKATVYNIGEAQKLAHKATYTSNLESSDDDEDSEILQVPTAPPAVTAKTLTAQTFSEQNDQADVLTELKKISKTLAGIKFETNEIKKDLMEVQIKLNSLLDKSSKITVPNVSKFSLPMTSQTQLDDLEEKINDLSGEEFQDLVTILAHVGGVTAKKNVHIIMKRLMNRELSLKYSAQGKKQKMNFSALRVYKAVLEAVKVNFPDAKDLEITQYIGTSLATSGDRDGGRSNRTAISSTNSQTT